MLTRTHVFLATQASACEFSPGVWESQEESLVFWSEVTTPIPCPYLPWSAHWCLQGTARHSNPCTKVPSYLQAGPSRGSGIQAQSSYCLVPFHFTKFFSFAGSHLSPGLRPAPGSKLGHNPCSFLNCSSVPVQRNLWPSDTTRR